MVQDIKDAADKRRQERAAVLQAVSGRADFGARLQPHLSYEYSDLDAHRDAGYILHLGIDNMLTAEHGPKVRALFHSFLETFFELPCACADAEERRKAAPNKGPSPAVARRRKKPKVGGSVGRKPSRASLSLC